MVMVEITFFEWSPPWHSIPTYHLGKKNIYWIYVYIYEFLFIPTFYLSFFLAYTLTLFSGILPGICSNILSGIYADLLSGIYSNILSDMLSGIYSNILSGTMSGIHLASILTFLLTWAQPDLKCERQISVDNASWAPISGACGWGPAVPTEIWHSQLGSGSAHWDLEFAGGRRKVIKSRDPHLAGGEIPVIWGYSPLKVVVSNPAW